MKNPVRSLVLAVAVVTLAAFAVACGSDDKKSSTSTGTTPAAAPTFAAGSTMDQIVKRGKITIGVKYDVPLFGLLDPVSRKVDGLDVAIGKEIAKALGLQENQI
jgi:glutamate transport system substrate-binding protein